MKSCSHAEGKSALLYLVTYSDVQCEAMVYVKANDSNCPASILLNYEFALHRAGKPWGCTIRHNGQFWGIVAAKSARDAINQFVESLEKEGKI